MTESHLRSLDALGVGRRIGSAAPNLRRPVAQGPVNGNTTGRPPSRSKGNGADRKEGVMIVDDARSEQDDAVEFHWRFP